MMIFTNLNDIVSIKRVKIFSKVLERFITESIFSNRCEQEATFPVSKGASQVIGETGCKLETSKVQSIPIAKSIEILKGD